MRRLSTALAALALAALSGCATAPQTAADDPYAPNDPLEGVNRTIFDFNLALDDYVLVPAARAYRTVVPEPGREGVKNFFNNLRSPLIFVNDVLQAEPGRAGETFMRMALNTTVGLGGILDVAGYLGIPYHAEDFGQTMGRWGVGEGPYLMLPILGPSNLRDATGTAGTFVADPFNIWMGNIDLEWVPFARTALDSVDARSRNIEVFEKIRETSLDTYATVRSLYRQRRASDIRNEDSANPSGNPISSQRPASE